MAHAQPEAADELISSINVTPLVDIFLVLLIIFMVTANLFLEQERKLREIPLTLPTAVSGTAPSPRPELLSVLIDREGRVYLNGTPVELAALGRRIDERPAGTPVAEVVVSADQNLPYGRVAHVVDFVKVHGVGNLAINVEEQTLWPAAPR
jgi:biopolymer transport protein ExbD